MNSLSHYMIGSYLSRYIKNEYGVRLNAAQFLYWNIMTDFRKPFTEHSHKAGCWEKHLKRETEALAGQKQTHTRFGPNYSKRLGVICHFYADFFCFPHASAYEGTLWQHIKYEWQLYRFMRRSFTALSGAVFGGVKDMNPDTDKIFSIYEKLHQSYLLKQPSFENDVRSTLRACLGAVTMITHASIITPAVLSQASSGQ